MSAQTEQPDYEALIRSAAEAAIRGSWRSYYESREALLAAIYRLKEENERLRKKVANLCPLA